MSDLKERDLTITNISLYSYYLYLYRLSRRLYFSKMVDPSADLCQIRDSFQFPLTQRSSLLNGKRPDYYSHPIGQTTLLKPQILTENISNLPPVYIEAERWNALVKSKNRFSELPIFTEGFRDKTEQSRFFRQVTRLTNPFEGIGNSIFGDRAGVKLANILAVFGLTYNLTTLIRNRTDHLFRFADLAGGPGAWTECLQFLCNGADGVGITLANNNDWRREIIDIRRFQFFYGDDNTGNLYTQWESFYRQVIGYYQGHQELGLDNGQSRNLINQGNPKECDRGNSAFDINPVGFHLVMADGAPDMDDDYNRQEWMAQHLILIECLLALKLLMKDGAFVCKMFSTHNLVSGQLLYLMSQCFDRITLFKPISSRPANEEQYLVCEGFRNNADQYLPILEAAGLAIKRIAESKYDEGKDRIVRLFTEETPSAFNEWLYRQNHRNIERQLIMAEVMVREAEVIRRGNPVNLEKYFPRYDLNQCLILWNLPDTPHYLDRSVRPRPNTIPYRPPVKRDPLNSFPEGRGKYSESSKPLRRLEPFPWMKEFLPPYKEMIRTLYQRQLNIKSLVVSDPTAQFRNKASMRLQLTPIDYYNGEAITNYFTEDIRIECIRNKQRNAKQEWDQYWGVLKKKTQVYQGVQIAGIRNEQLFKLRQLTSQYSTECENLSVTFGAFIIRLLGAKRIIDPSSRWGDFAISAMLANAERYVGYEDNLRLEEGYQKLTEFLREQKLDCQFHLKKFESLDPTNFTERESNFDLVLTKLPGFNLESFNNGEVQERSYTEWLSQFLKPYLDNVWRFLKIRGHLALIIEDQREVPVREDVQKVISQKSGEYLGQLSYQYSESSQLVHTVFIWQKLA